MKLGCFYMTSNTRKPLAPFGVRMDDDLKAWVANRAARNNRSMNAEIVTIFQELREKEETGTKQAA